MSRKPLIKGALVKTLSFSADTKTEDKLKSFSIAHNMNLSKTIRYIIGQYFSIYEGEKEAQ